ncbi:MAG: hypothetical protein CVV48_13000 [Spirochaetae bacterium HGW-Spirochaetae-4]|jgi:phage repressor protein C with HTH and peptisase S24 domain|nr:MAG: hypothetical protein CVV48_13000 [Spirochaetae bacterium HGW-Spirochaetae-4]
MFMKEFWIRAEGLRRAINLTRKELGGKIEVSPKTIDNWVARDIVPSGDKCFALANALGATVEYLFTGDEIALPDDPYIVADRPRIYNQNGIVPQDDEEPTFLIPVAPQRISAGNGEDFLTESKYIGHVRILERMAKGVDKTSLIAAAVKGDSMTGVQIFEGDLVIFARGHISENGIYVISLFGEVKVKRLEFRAAEQKIYIHSENSRYSTESVTMENENLIILGKVVGWVHCHPY